MRRVKIEESPDKVRRFLLCDRRSQIKKVKIKLKRITGFSGICRDHIAKSNPVKRCGISRNQLQTICKCIYSAKRSYIIRESLGKLQTIAKRQSQAYEISQSYRRAPPTIQALQISATKNEIEIRGSSGQFLSRGVYRRLMVS
jgi:hypothetical protein